MGKVDNQSVRSFDDYTRQDWTDFLKQRAYRGLEINKVAKKLNYTEPCKFNTKTRELINFKGKCILDMNKLMKKGDRWAFSRLIHNIRMCFSDSKYAVEFNARISRLVGEIVQKTTQEFSLELSQFVNAGHRTKTIKKFFNNNLRVINRSSGDQGIQDDLLKLADKTLKQAENAGGRALAFEIQWTAKAMMPDPNLVWEVFPAEIQGLILMEACKSEGKIKTINGSFNHPLTVVSKKVSENALETKNGSVIHDLYLKKQDFKNAKEAVDYIIKYKLDSAHLRNFNDLAEEDLEKLSQNWPNLKRLDIRSKHIKGDKLVEVVGAFPHLEMLELSFNNQITGDQLVAMAKKLPNLKKLGAICSKITRAHVDQIRRKDLIIWHN